MRNLKGTLGADRVSLANGWLSMSSEDVLWRLLIPLIVLAQITALVSGWKRAYKLAGAAVAFSPLLLLYTAYLLKVENEGGGPSSSPAQVALFLLLLSGVIGISYLAGARLPAFPLWIAWAINLVPLAFIIFIVCCFRLQF